LFDDWTTQMVADMPRAFPASLRSVAVEWVEDAILPKEKNRHFFVVVAL